MVHHITSAMENKWDSVAFGNALLQYAGAEGIFRRAEQRVTTIPKRGKDDPDNLNKSVHQFFDFLNDETSKMLEITDAHKRTLLQYLVYAKSFDEGVIDYDKIYRTSGNYCGEKIFEGVVAQVSIYENGVIRCWANGHPLGFARDDFGKTVFLTKEEAEKALAERSQHNDNE